MLLKLNSTGPDVKLLQKALKIKDDGIFGKDTLNAVKAYQSKNSIPTTGIVDNITWNKLFPQKVEILKYNPVQLKAAILNKNYIWYEDKINLIGIRNKSSNLVTNLFDDYLSMTYKVNGSLKFELWPITTDPGKYYMQDELLNPKGCAILKPDQYIDSYGLGLHKGQYEALVQIKPVTVYRDRDKDNIYEYLNPETGLFGINIHKAGADSATVDKHSAGCQVHKKSSNFDTMRRIANEFKKIQNNKYTYTLLESTDIK